MCLNVVEFIGKRCASTLGESAAALVHEASHRVTERHHQCINTLANINCDASPEGAYGIEFWWLHNYMLT